MSMSSMLIDMKMHDMQHDVDDDWLSSSEAAALLPATSAPTLLRWAKSGKVEATRLPSGRYLFRRSAILALLEPVSQEDRAQLRDVPIPGLGRAGR